MIHPIDMGRYPRSRDIPIIILQRVQIGQSDGNIPVVTVGWVGYTSTPVPLHHVHYSEMDLRK